MCGHVESATSGCYQSDIFEATLVFEMEFETLFAVEILENQFAAPTEEMANYHCSKIPAGVYTSIGFVRSIHTCSYRETVIFVYKM